MIRPTNQAQEAFSWSIQLAAVTADTTYEVAKPSKPFVITKARLVNPTGLAVDAANFFDLQVLIGATLAANWSTETGEEGALVAGTWVDMSLASTAARKGDADEEVSVFLNETGAASLPSGALFIEGFFL